MKAIRDSFHAQFQDVRNFNNLLQGDDFEVVYNAATDEQYKKLEQAIDQLNKNILKCTIENILEKLTPFDQMGVRRLREIGRNLRIDNYTYLSKLDLVEEIQNVVQRLKSGGDGKPVQSQQIQ